MFQTTNQIWVWVNTYRYIFSGMNIHLPAILGFTRVTRFWPIPISKSPSTGFPWTCASSKIFMAPKRPAPAARSSGVPATGNWWSGEGFSGRCMDYIVVYIVEFICSGLDNDIVYLYLYIYIYIYLYIYIHSIYIYIECIYIYTLGAPGFRKGWGGGGMLTSYSWYVDGWGGVGHVNVMFMVRWWVGWGGAC